MQSLRMVDVVSDVLVELDLALAGEVRLGDGWLLHQPAEGSAELERLCQHPITKTDRLN